MITEIKGSDRTLEAKYESVCYFSRTYSDRI